MGIAKEDAAASDGIKVGRLDNVIDATGAIDLSQERCVASPVVSKEKEQIGSVGSRG